MPRVTADVGQPLQRLGVHAARHEVVQRVRHPGRGSLHDERLEEAFVGDEPGRALVEREVHQPGVGVVANDLLEQAAGERADRLLHESREHGLLDDGLHIAVRDAMQRMGAHGGHLVDEALGVLVGEHPLRGATGRLSVEHPLPDDLLVEEVLADEILETPADHLLLAWDERRVRDGQPERVAEQRGDREPVCARPDHRGLGSGVDEAEQPVVVAPREDVDDRGEDEEPRCDEPHLAQVAASLGVEDRVDDEAESPAHSGLLARVGPRVRSRLRGRTSGHRSSHASRRPSRCAPRCVSPPRSRCPGRVRAGEGGRRGARQPQQARPPRCGGR